MGRSLRFWIDVWSSIWTLALPLILFYLWLRGRKDAVYRSAIHERFGFYPRSRPGAVWIHAVSLGELRSAVPLIQALLAQGDRVITTHFTPAGRREAERFFAQEIAAGTLQVVWVPLETGWAYRGFIRAFRPRCGLVMEIEIWPQMIASARAARVPLLMCNAQYPSKSFARDSARLPIRQALMRGFSGAIVKSELQRDRFAAIGVGNIAVTGELRFDQPVPAALVAAGQAARRWIGAGERRVITIASTVEGEDPIYLQAIEALRASHDRRELPPPLIVYVPRRPERFDEVAGTLIAAGLRVLRRSSLGQIFDPQTWGASPAMAPDVLFGDSLGEMYGYLAMADQVIVGGGFMPCGAHNISEALVLGRPVLCGPEVHTIEYPFVEAESAGVVLAVADADDLARALVEGFRPEPKAIEAFLRSHCGATQRTLAALPGLLDRSARPTDHLGRRRD